MIRDAVEIYLKDKNDWSYSPSYDPRLWVSDIGNCPRKALMRIMGYEPEPFKVDSLEYMNDGVVLEDSTVSMLKYVYGGQNVKEQVRVYNDLWSGKIDALIHAAMCSHPHAGGDPVIVEHKATGSKWWNYKDNLPRLAHVCQLVLYGQLFQEQFNENPGLWLYYRAWGHYAELCLRPGETNVFAHGIMDGEYYEKDIQVNVKALRLELEAYFKACAEYLKVQQVAKLSRLTYEEKESLLPPKLEDQDDGCIFRGKPSCPMYKHCWGKVTESEIPF